ncbi:UNVERIFIED_CONTAM: hypothetical protein Scaly_2580500 [Sesamum calycinum]|uniref:Reverse transcriptase domain-containing protein n=1 Tax=Sesamum calycinum TaxID=2727403 RepID=A0AAW2JEJ0_9LAMI
MATTAGGSSPPLRTYHDAVAGVAVRPLPPLVSFDTASFWPLGMLTRDQGMKVLRFSSEEIARLSQSFRYALVGKFSHGYPSMQHLRRWMLAQGFRGDFSVGAINDRHVFIKFALEEDYTKLWIKSICITRLLGTPLRTDVSTATLVRPSVARVCVEINFLEPLQTEIGLGFGTEMIIQPVVYERLPKYCATCKHLGHDDYECYDKIKNRKPVRPVEGEDQRASDHVDLREKLDAQRAQRELHTRRKGKRVVFEEVGRCPEASSSGAKGAEDGSVAMKLQDTVHEPEPKLEPELVPELEPLFHEEAVDGGTEKDMPISQSPPDVCQGIVNVATCPLEPAVPREPLPQDDSPVCVEPHPDTEDVALCPSGESTLQSDTENITKRLARHRRGRSLGDEPEAHSASPDRGKVRILNRVRKQHHLDFLAIMELMVPLDGRFMARRLGFLDVVFNCGNQIWFFWGPDVRCQVLVEHEQLLHVWLESNKWPKPLFVMAVYAKCDTVERRALWDALRAISVGASPWIVGGDFNTVLSPDERSGGSAPSGIAMSDFHDAIADCALIDAGYVGSPYTWYNRRLRQRLDRVLISSCWMTVFPKIQVAHLELSQSDHRGLLVEVEFTMERKPTVGSGMMRLQQKLTRLKHYLKEWNKTVFGNVFDNVAAAERGLKEADEAYDQDPCDRTLVERNRCSTELVRVLAQEETFWRKRRVLDGPKMGSETRDISTLWYRSGDSERLLIAEPVFPEEMDSEHLEDSLTDEDRRFLCVMPTLEEVREAVLTIDSDSVAGPDGFGAVFYHTCWEIIFEDVFGAVTELFRGVKMPKGFTATTISLIPKTASPTCWSEYRTISLCNVTNKICTKLMTIRLGHVLPKVISLSQSGFVPGRLLSDNVLLAQELLHSLESRRPDANVVFKLDMAKAYDRVSWEFLYQALRRKGFPQRWIGLVANAISHCWFSVLVNAHPTMFYQAPGLIRVSHLAYADGLMIFTTTCHQNMELLHDFLRAYERVSGQLINGLKSSFIVGRQASSLQTQAVQDMLGYQLKHLPVTVGNDESLPWGRLALIRSVLQATPLHLLQACFPVAEGGLGVRSLADYVRAFSMKLWWRFRGKSSLWSESCMVATVEICILLLCLIIIIVPRFDIASVVFEMWPNLLSSGPWVKVLYLFGTIIGLARSP